MKKVLCFSFLFLLFVTISYTYSSFTNRIVGNIVATSNNWSFKVNVENGSVENDYYKVPITNSSGQVNITINTSQSNNRAEYTIELTGYNLPSDIAYYKDSNYTNVIDNNIYKGIINKNTGKTITIYYKSSSAINGYLYIKVKGNVYAKELAMMKNIYGSIIGNYESKIKSIVFTGDMSNKPETCTDAKKCWDISYDSNQDVKVYAYLIGTCLYIASENIIAAPIDSSFLFGYSKLESIEFNDYFDTSKVTLMKHMFSYCSTITSLDLSIFDTQKVTDMSGMFYNCKKLSNLNLSSFDTSKVTKMTSMFEICSSLTELNLSNFDTSKVIAMNHMFGQCEQLENLELGTFSTISTYDFGYMFQYCYKVRTTITISTSTIITNSEIYMFTSAATDSNALVTINYTSAASSVVDKIMKYVSSESNVVKGKQL